MTSCTDPNPFLLPAYLGLRPDWGRNLVLVRVCAWCDSKKAVEQEAKRLGYGTTHGVCPAHFKAQLAKLTGDRSDLTEPQT